MKNTLIIVLAFLIMIAVGIFIYRYNIIQYSAEAIIRKYMPSYVSIDKIKFYFDEEKIALKGFRIVNPPNFSYKYLIEIDEIDCKYRMKGKNILDGLEIFDPVFKRPALNIERLSDSKINVGEMPRVIEAESTKKESPKKPEPKKGNGNIIGNKKISDILKLPKDFAIKGGKMIFLDRLVSRQPHIITLENIEATLSLVLDETYSRVIEVGSVGKGNVNGVKGEIVHWNSRFDPTTPSLTMSNRFDVTDVDILPFEPYYYRYSPFIFQSGRFSGALVFDFDNGNIGSMDEVRLSNLKFQVKQDYQGAQFWDAAADDLIKYFSNSFGEVVFDFRIKGDMAHPTFYLGPISKQAIASMAIDKISTAIEQAAGPKTSGSGNSNIDKAKEYIDLFKGLINKK